MRASLLLVVVAAGSQALVMGCSADPVPSGGPSTGSASREPVGVSRQAIGEQQSGFPSPWERATFMAANRARSDPATVKGTGSTVYPAVKPLVLEYPLEQSSRFHATNLQLGDVTLMHTSPCTLNTNVATSGCTGDPACACAMPVPATCSDCAMVAAENDCGTDPFTRIHYFYPAANAEVAAAGYRDPWSLMDGWVDEATGSDGHRTIIDSVGSNEGVAGFGHASGTGDCFGTFDVGDFGPATTAPPAIASAASNPISATAAATFILYATWNDPVGGAPADINAVVDGACTAMTLELGTPKLNATYQASVPLTAGCHSVFIVADSASAARTLYPTTTAFTIPVAVAAGSCADEVAQPVAHCAGVDGGVGGSEAGVDSGGVADAGAIDAHADASVDSGGGTVDAGATDAHVSDGGGVLGTDASGVDAGALDTGAAPGEDAGVEAGATADAATTTESGTIAEAGEIADGGGSVGSEGGVADGAVVVGAEAGGVGQGLEAGVDASNLGPSDSGSDVEGQASSGSGCACGVAPSPHLSDAWTALLAVGAVLPLRRRRRGGRGDAQG